MKKNAKKSKVNQVRAQRRQLEVGELELVYGGGGDITVLLTDSGTKG